MGCEQVSTPTSKNDPSFPTYSISLNLSFVTKCFPLKLQQTRSLGICGGWCGAACAARPHSMRAIGPVVAGMLEEVRRLWPPRVFWMHAWVIHDYPLRLRPPTSKGRSSGQNTCPCDSAVWAELGSWFSPPSVSFFLCPCDSSWTGLGPRSRLATVAITRGAVTK